MIIYIIMSLYSSQAVNTMYLEPSLHNSSRLTEFRIKHAGKILPNLRLIEVGMQQDGATSAHYNNLGGVKSMIRNIHLYDGKTSLSSMIEAPQYQAFKIFNQDVSKNKSLEQQLNQSNNVVVGQEEHKASDILSLFQDNRTQSEQALGDTGKAWIDLRDYFPILKVLNHLDTENVFKNLRVVVEYRLDAEDVLMENNTPGKAISPRLVFDAVEDPDAMAPNPETVSWMEIETDSFEVSASGNGAQTVSARINGFTNKSLGKLVMAKQCTDKTIYVDTNNVLGFGPLSSVAQLDEKVQLTINGTQKFPRDGLESKGNRGLAMLADLWGESSAFAFASVPNIQNLATETSANVTNLAGQLSWIPYDNSGERVGDFEVEYKRTNNTATGAPRYCENKALTVRLYGEVSKSIMFKSGGDYNIIYN